MTAFEYEKEIEKLFSAWQAKPKTDDIDHSDRFIKDGVVCPEKWFSQDVRPLFLLKEAYTVDGKMQDLIADRLMKNDDGISKMWERVSDWTRSLMILSETGEIVPFGSQEKIKNYENEYLEQIAVINIKKSSGKKESNDENLKKYAGNDAKEIVKQLEICDPTLIICGYTGQYLFDALKTKDINVEVENRNDFQKEHFIYTFELNGHMVQLVNFWHPANQFPDIMNYYCLMHILKGIL